MTDNQNISPEKISGAIRLSDTAQITTFGEEAQRDVSAFADKVLQQTRNRDLGETAELLTNLMATAKGLDFTQLQNAGPIARLVGGVRRKLINFRARFQTVSAQVDGISQQLQKRLDRMRGDLAMLDGLHEQARASVAILDSYIAAGKSFVEQFRAKDLPQLAAMAAKQSGDPSQDVLNGQAYQDALMALDRLEKRVYTLQQTRQIALQQLPQIRVVQNGDATLIESLGASLTLTIPAWKQKMVMMLGLEHQREALAMQKAVTETTNDMIRRSAEMLKVQALGIEQESQRGVVDLTVLAKSNQDLLDTISGVMRLQSEGHTARTQAAAEMERQTAELHNILSGGQITKMIAA
ncbi:MAG TPA: toxic anion resistance protein [Rhizomicrobium sp.]|jgi:uncharacterized protein YaaN involved in tellurite resistance